MKVSFKLGFTLAEATITLVLLSVLLAVMIPAATNIAPNNVKVAFKSAYGIVNQIIEGLISNQILYPSTPQDMDEEGSVQPNGFLYDKKTHSLLLPNGTETPNAVDYVANEYNSYIANCACTNSNAEISKLMALFCCSLNVTSAVCSSKTQCVVTSTNGMQWTLETPATACSSSSLTSPCLIITVDVNGPSGLGSTNHPNSSACTVSDSEITSRIPDIYKFNVYYDGKVGLDSSTASSACAKVILKEPTRNRKKR